MRYLTVDMVSNEYHETTKDDAIGNYDKVNDNYYVNSVGSNTYKVACKTINDLNNLIILLNCLGFNDHDNTLKVKNYHYVNINVPGKLAILGKLDKAPKDYDWNFTIPNKHIYARNSPLDWSRSSILVAFPSYRQALKFLTWLSGNGYETLDCYEAI